MLTHEVEERRQRMEGQMADLEKGSRTYTHLVHERDSSHKARNGEHITGEEKEEGWVRVLSGRQRETHRTTSTTGGGQIDTCYRCLKQGHWARECQGMLECHRCRGAGIANGNA